MQNVYTVKQINSYIRNMFTQDYLLARVYVKGEVSNCKYHTSGHLYFSLKDESGTIACVMFAGQRAGLSFPLCNGQQVIVLGSFGIYEKSGNYQLYAKEIVPDGDGVLYEKFQRLKEELEEMGMFAPEYKKDIPRYARRVGIVTAPTGAAVRDIMNIAGRRNPYVQLLLCPALVQGDGAADSIVSGIQRLDRENLDVIIIGRGGGSIEDLWPFNEEKVARAIFDCRTPVISAVGHETDTTIADYVADLRAPTPSAAAELAVYDVGQVELVLKESEVRLSRLMRQHISEAKSRCDRYQVQLKYLHPRQMLREKQQRLSDMEERLRNLMEGRLSDSRHRTALYVERIKALSPISRLNQGYAYVRGRDGKALRSIKQTTAGERLQIHVADGYIDARVEGMTEENYGKEEGYCERDSVWRKWNPNGREDA